MVLGKSLGNVAGTLVIPGRRNTVVDDWWVCGIGAPEWIVYTKKRRWAVDIDEDRHCHGVS